MHANETAAAADIPLESSLLVLVKNVSGRRKKDHCLKWRQAVIGEYTRILGRHDAEIVQHSQLLDRRNAIRNRGMTKRRCFGKNQDLERVSRARYQSRSH